MNMKVLLRADLLLAKKRLLLGTGLVISSMEVEQALPHGL